LMVEANCRLVMVLRAAGEAGCCPGCRNESRRIHSHYKRRLKDLPWEGIPVQIELRVRRFFCRTENCGHQIFTERLPSTVQRYARRTRRLSSSLEQITRALGGSAGSRLAQQLGILASSSTLLRQLRRRVIVPSARSPRVLGIDDWAWRKGHRYGTILCDLESGKVVDLLPDRSTESTAQWLRTHPGAEIVSRDRASLYAQAATSAAQLERSIYRRPRAPPSFIGRGRTRVGKQDRCACQSASPPSCRDEASLSVPQEARTQS
jgi:transposase